MFLYLFLQASQDETMKQNEALINEIECLRGDLQKTRNDRDQQQSQLEAVKIEHERYKECAEKSFTELEKSTLKSNELEVSVCHFPLVLVLILILKVIMFCHRPNVHLKLISSEN